MTSVKDCTTERTVASDTDGSDVASEGTEAFGFGTVSEGTETGSLGILEEGSSAVKAS